MAYTPVNIPIFVAAYSGALAGMGSSNRVPSSNDVNSYTDLAREAGAFAEAFDIAWGNAEDANSFEVESAQTLCESAWQSRTPFHIAQYQDADSYHALANALVAIVQAGSVYFAANAITPPPAGGATFGGDLVAESDTVQRHVGVRAYPTENATGAGDAFPITTQDAAIGSGLNGGALDVLLGRTDVSGGTATYSVKLKADGTVAPFGNADWEIVHFKRNGGWVANATFGGGTDSAGAGVAAAQLSAYKQLNLASHVYLACGVINGADIATLAMQNIQDGLAGWNGVGLRWDYTTRNTGVSDDTGIQAYKRVAGLSGGVSRYFDAIYGVSRRWGIRETGTDAVLELYGKNTVAASMTATGTAPPVLTVAGQAGFNVSALWIQITGAGARGVATFQFSIDAGVTYNGSNILTGAAIVLPGLGTGLTVSMANNVFSVDNLYKSVATMGAPPATVGMLRLPTYEFGDIPILTQVSRTTGLDLVVIKRYFDSLGFGSFAENNIFQSNTQSTFYCNTGPGWQYFMMSGGYGFSIRSGTDPVYNHGDADTPGSLHDGKIFTIKQAVTAAVTANTVIATITLQDEYPAQPNTVTHLKATIVARNTITGDFCSYVHEWCYSKSNGVITPSTGGQPAAVDKGSSAAAVGIVPNFNINGGNIEIRVTPWSTDNTKWYTNIEQDVVKTAV